MAHIAYPLTPPLTVLLQFLNIFGASKAQSPGARAQVLEKTLPGPQKFSKQAFELIMMASGHRVTIFGGCRITRFP